MKLEEFLNLMFPGDPVTGLPSYAELELDVSSWLEPSCATSISNELLNLSEELLNDDVNIGIKKIKKNVPEQMTIFIVAALEAYFSSPNVIITLRQGHATIFPHSRTVTELDPELLMPVWERSKEGGG